MVVCSISTGDNPCGGTVGPRAPSTASCNVVFNSPEWRDARPEQGGGAVVV
jgi:hypothetical protein